MEGVPDVAYDEVKESHYREGGLIHGWLHGFMRWVVVGDNYLTWKRTRKDSKDEPEEKKTKLDEVHDDEYQKKLFTAAQVSALIIFDHGHFWPEWLFLTSDHFCPNFYIGKRMKIFISVLSIEKVQARFVGQHSPMELESSKRRKMWSYKSKWYQR